MGLLDAAGGGGGLAGGLGGELLAGGFASGALASGLLSACHCEVEVKLMKSWKFRCFLLAVFFNLWQSTKGRGEHWEFQNWSHSGCPRLRTRSVLHQLSTRGRGRGGGSITKNADGPQRARRGGGGGGVRASA